MAGETLFKPGQSGNPAGRTKGAVGGRTRALLVLDSMLGEERNVERLREALQTMFDKDPAKFFRDIVMPLLPKESVGKLESGDKVIEWRGLLSVCGGDAQPAAGVSAVIDV